MKTYIDVLKDSSGNEYHVTKEMWAYSLLLASARTKSNDFKRRAKSDRGDKNLGVDLVGSFAELFTLTLIRKFQSEASAFKSNMFHPQGGGLISGADIIGGTSSVDVKSFDCAPNKRYFAINARKHRELAGTNFYYCVLSPSFGQKAVVTLVPYADVDQWDEFSLGKYGDASKNINLNSFYQKYMPSIDGGTDHYSAQEVSELSHQKHIRDKMITHFQGIEKFI